MDNNESFYDKLKSLNVHLGASHIKTAQKPRTAGYGIETVVKGTDLPTVYGLAFLSEEHYPADYIHGQFPLCIERPMDVLAAWGGTPRITTPGGQNVVFLDTETTGLAGGAGTYAFLVGIGYRTETGFALIQFFMRGPEAEPALLAALDTWLSRFDTVITFNGKSFDVPLLNNRYIMNGLSSPFGQYQHLDVLQIARKLWRDRLPSRALGDLEKEIIRYYRTSDEVPGWMIPQLYTDYLFSGDARPLGGVFYHNAVDILTLAALYGYIANLIKDPLSEPSCYALDMAAIARLYEDMGRIEQAAELYERSLASGELPQEFFFKTIERYAVLRRRQGEWDRAVQLWHKAAEHGHPSACVELAKYFEHRERNNAEALKWARKALENLERTHLYTTTFEREIERRIGRLVQRVYRDF
jgi:uncharacterized protein